MCPGLEELTFSTQPHSVQIDWPTKESLGIGASSHSLLDSLSNPQIGGGSFTSAQEEDETSFAVDLSQNLDFLLGSQDPEPEDAEENPAGDKVNTEDEKESKVGKDEAALMLVSRTITNNKKCVTLPNEIRFPSSSS